MDERLHLSLETFVRIATGELCYMCPAQHDNLNKLSIGILPQFSPRATQNNPRLIRDIRHLQGQLPSTVSFSLRLPGQAALCAG